MIRKILEFDSKVYAYYDKLPTNIFTKFFGTFTYLASGGSYGLLISFILFFIGSFRGYSYLIFFGILLNLVDVNLFLKKIVRRTRPFNKSRYGTAHIRKPKDFSFPSGHSAVSATISGLLIYMGIVEEFGVLFIVCNIIFVLLMGYSRIRLKVHFFSDVVVGILVGTLNVGIIIFISDYLIKITNMFLALFGL